MGDTLLNLLTTSIRKFVYAQDWILKTDSFDWSILDGRDV